MASAFHDLASSIRLALRRPDQPFTPFANRAGGEAIFTRWLQLRLLGAIFVVAFASLWTQVHGLIGPNGLLPVDELLAALSRAAPGARGVLAAPSLLWLDATDRGLDTLCATGTLAGVLLLANLWPRFAIFWCWTSFLSFVTVARNFSHFQSDGLLLETALLAFFLAPSGPRPGLGERAPPHPLVAWLVKFLAFRLVAEAGLAKLTSVDPSWRELRAMDAYYENCPFPSRVGWWAQQLPPWFHGATTAFTLLVETVGAISLLVRGWPRRIAVLAWTLLQLGIMLTASYSFLNLLAILLGLSFVSDEDWRRLVRRLPRLQVRRARSPRGLGRVVAFLLLAWPTYVASMLFLGTFGLPLAKLPDPLRWAMEVEAPFRSANRFALFAAMTTERREIEFEGSDDGGQTFRPYPFRFKPQELDRPPRFMAPHQPRFEWNLWFAVLSDYREYTLVRRAGVELMQGEPSVIALFGDNPFPDRPPDLLRFPLYRYRMTSSEMLARTGLYWSRERIGYYAPTLYRAPDGSVLASPDPSDAQPTPE